jgi:hypothetical protein
MVEISSSGSGEGPAWVTAPGCSTPGDPATSANAEGFIGGAAERERACHFGGGLAGLPIEVAALHHGKQSNAGAKRPRCGSSALQPSEVCTAWPISVE